MRGTTHTTQKCADDMRACVLACRIQHLRFAILLWSLFFSLVRIDSRTAPQHISHTTHHGSAFRNANNRFVVDSISTQPVPQWICECRMSYVCRFYFALPSLRSLPSCRVSLHPQSNKCLPRRRKRSLTNWWSMKQTTSAVRTAENSISFTK